MTKSSLTKIETMMVDNAKRWWPGTEDHLLAIWRCLNGKRGAGIGAAMLINIALTNKGKTRADAFEELRERVQSMASTRSSAKQDRHIAAMRAIEALLEMHGGAT